MKLTAPTTFTLGPMLHHSGAVIADTRAIADTVLIYLMAALTGRNPMFQLKD